MTAAVLAPLGAMFRHAKGTDPDAEEILILTFNHDLAFFEKAALAVAQLTGARITVVADAAMAHHDVYAVRRAGTAYLPGLAHCAGSFHPKLVVIASSQRATVGIGSGNLSMAGWQGNDELWSWHHSPAGGGSAVVAATGQWLRDLATAVTLALPVAEALRRVGGHLSTFTADDATCRLVGTIAEPILEQLPVGPVDELNVYAPFYDPGGGALAALVERLQPAALRIGYQPTMTRINGAAASAVVGPTGEIRELSQERYRHGKLIEWNVEGQRWALTGSANISAAALLRTVTGGGNVELGVIAPVPASLMPTGVIATQSHLAMVPYRGMAPASGPSTVILAATRAPAGVEVEFLRAVREGGRVEVSELDWAPDQWEPIAEIEPGATRLVVRDLPGGSRVRVRSTDGTRSAVAWVSDLTRVQQARRAVRSGPTPPELGEVFSDAAAAEKFFQLLDRQTEGHTPGAPTGRAEGGGSKPDHIESWEEYLDRCVSRVGAYTFAFAFGLSLPASRTDQAVRTRATDWDDDALDDDAEALEGDTTEDADIDESRGLTVPQLTKAQDKVRARYRAVARRMIHDWAAPDPQERLLGLRSTLLLVAGGAWDHTEDDWRPLVLEGVDRLRVDGAGDEYLRAAASLALLALSIVKNTLSAWDPGLVERRYERTVERAAELLIEADEDRINEYADGLTRRFPGSARANVALDLLERLTSADEMENAVDDLADAGVVVQQVGRVIDLDKQVPNPLLAALMALAVVEGVSPVAVRCASADSKFVNVLWHPPDLVVIESPRPGALLTRHYEYKAGRRPGSDIRLENRLDPSRCVASTSVKEALPAVAAEMLGLVGMVEPGPPIAPR